MLNCRVILRTVKPCYSGFRYLPRGGIGLIRTDNNFNEESEQIKTSMTKSSSIKNRPFIDEKRQNRETEDDYNFQSIQDDLEQEERRPRLDPYERKKRDRSNILRNKEIPVEDETLLTWSAMDQIRELHESDPKTWTPEKIADSFPISVQGARRFLGSKKPRNFTEEMIEEHDYQVKQRWRAIKKGIPGVVSEKTLWMIEQGFIKYLPMKSFKSEKESSFSDDNSAEKIELKMDESEIEFHDGPFTKLYKRHLKWKNSMKLDKPIESNEKMATNREELLRSVVFSNVADKTTEKDNVMMFEDFQKLYKQRVRASRNRLDQKYYNSSWMDRKSRNKRYRPN